MKKVALMALCASISAQSIAQTVVTPPTSPTEAPLQIVTPASANTVNLPANTQITMSMNDTVTSKGKKFNEGDTFDLTVTHDVLLGQYVIIPKGARGVGRITWMTSKGMFGKSGKMEISLEYVEVSGRRIPVKGNFRQEGEGNTVATVGTVIAVGVFAAFVTGKSATIPQGRELTAYTKDDLPVALPGPITANPIAVQAAQPVQAVPTAAPTPAAPATPAPETSPKPPTS